MKMYPYVGDDTLLCFTWNQDVSNFYRLRINPTKNAGSRFLVYRKLYNLCTNLINMSSVLNPPNTAFN